METLSDHALESRIGKYVSVGAVGAVIDLSVSVTITLVGLFPPEWAKFVGAETAIILMFFLNDRWTFAGFGEMSYRHQLVRLLRSNLVRSVGLLLQVGIVWYLTSLATVVVVGVDVWALAAMGIAIVASFIVNYIAESLLTWRVTGTLQK